MAELTEITMRIQNLKQKLGTLQLHQTQVTEDILKIVDEIDSLILEHDRLMSSSF